MDFITPDYATAQETILQNVERRRKPRIYNPIPITINGIGSDGDRFEFESIADNVSAGGLSTPAPRTVCVGEELSFLIRFSLGGTRLMVAPTILARGIVLRAHDLPDGTSRIGVAFIRSRIL